MVSLISKTKRIAERSAIVTHTHTHTDRQSTLHCKKRLAIFPSPAGMSLAKLSLGGNDLNYSRPGRVWSLTSQLGTGKRLTFSYSVAKYMVNMVNGGGQASTR
jgi:hypothetical protein